MRGTRLTDFKLSRVYYEILKRIGVMVVNIIAQSHSAVFPFDNSLSSRAHLLKQAQQTVETAYLHKP